MNAPRFSILLHARHSTAPPNPAIDSLKAQTFPDWELIVGAEGAGADIPGSKWAWARGDCRIKVVSLPNDVSAGQALNLVARQAAGELIGYLEAEAEFSPDYLERVTGAAGVFDVALCRHERAIAENGAAAVVLHDPGATRTLLFIRRIARLLGIIHRRELLERAGGFNELLPNGYECDLLRRSARLGASFAFLPITAGRYTALDDGEPKLPGAQLARLDENRRARKPLFGTPAGWMYPKQVTRILFVCPHCVLDYTNGASLAVMQALRWLHGNGFSARAFCLCDHADPDRDHAGARAGPPPTELERSGVAGAEAGDWQTITAGVPITLRRVAHYNTWQVTGATRGFLDIYERLLAERRPDVVVTYGGDCLSLAVMEAAKHRDIPVVFWLHNFAYPERLSFQFVDRVIVPSDFSREFHWRSLGLDCCTVPNLIDWPRVRAQRRTPKYVTFVNPALYKGAVVFAAIAERLAALRPDIPLLVVEGRTSPGSQHSLGRDLASFPNVHLMPATADPRQFYSLTRLLLLPSLWNESFGLVAAEAMVNGIPVLASNRGALPEIIGDGGYLFSVPERYAQNTRDIPSADEVQPWIDRIITLWNDPVAYLGASQRAHSRAEAWRPERIGPLYRDFFASISPQPAPPLLNWP